MASFVDVSEHLNELASSLADNDDESKLNALTFLCFYFDSLKLGEEADTVVEDALVLRSEGSIWPGRVHFGVMDLISSRLDPDKRSKCFRILAFMTRVFGPQWIFSKHSESRRWSGKEVGLISQLCRIEVGVLLTPRYEDRSSTSTSASSMDCETEQRRDMSELEVLTIQSCFELLEMTMRYLTEALALEDGEHPPYVPSSLGKSYETGLKQWSSLSADTIMSVLRSVNECMSVVLPFFCEHATLPPQSSLLLRSAFRLIAMWMAEETAAYRGELMEALPHLFAFVEESMEDERWYRLGHLIPGLGMLVASDDEGVVRCDPSLREALLRLLQCDPPPPLGEALKNILSQL